jgi:hypothetical protein
VQNLAPSRNNLFARRGVAARRAFFLAPSHHVTVALGNAVGLPF